MVDLLGSWLVGWAVARRAIGACCWDVDAAAWLCVGRVGVDSIGLWPSWLPVGGTDFCGWLCTECVGVVSVGACLCWRLVAGTDAGAPALECVWWDWAA
jgi:hypothetical protein